MFRSRKLGLMALTLAAVALAVPARAAELEKLTPADAQFVMVFNVRQAINSPLAKKKGITDLIKKGIESNAEAKQLFAAIGIDLTKDVETVAISASNLTDLQGGKKPEKMLITVRGNFDPDRIDAAAKKVDKIKTSKEGNVTVYEFNDKGDPGFMTVIGKNIIAFAPSKAYLLKAVKNVGGGSKELVKACAKVDGKQSVWMAMALSDELRQMMAAAPQAKPIVDKMESITVGVHVTDAIALDMNINMSDAETVKMMKTQIDAILPLVRGQLEADEKTGDLAKAIFGGLKITANPDALNINVKVNEDTLDKIIKLVGAFGKPGAAIK